MADLTKVNGVANADIVKIDGVAAADIQKVDGVDKAAATTTATRWLCGTHGSVAVNGEIYTTTQTDGASGWEFVIDFNPSLTNVINDIVTGKDPEGNKRFICHGSHQNNEVHYASASLSTAELQDAANWTGRNPDKHADGTTGGPALAWGNDVWVMGGDDEDMGDGTYDNMFRSTDGGYTWAHIDNNNTIADVCFAVAYKGSGGIWLAGTQSHIWKSTDDGATWTDQGALEGTKDVRCICYNGEDRWVAGLQHGRLYTSDDDGENWTWQSSNIFGGARTVHSAVYAKGTINKWVIVGVSGEISYSSDAETWTNIRTANASGSYVNYNQVATDDTTIVIVGNDGTILTSTDAINWAASTSMSDHIGTLNIRSISHDLIGTGYR